VSAKLYWFAASHPAQAARKMLELKGIDHRLAVVLPGMQRVHMRVAGFRGGTVPALKLDGRRVQGSRQIARAVEELVPEPPLFPADPELRARADEAERWGDEELQDVPRLIFRWGLVRDPELRRWLAERSNVPLPGVVASTGGPTARYFARAIGADEAAVRRELEALPATLDRADALLADGTLATDPPNAAALQVLCSVRALDAFGDLHEHVRTHASAAAARRLFPDYPEPIPPFLPPDLLAALAPKA
jgi:glutathione S-transferase